MICHENDNRSVKLFCDKLLDDCPGLGLNLKFLGDDGEISVLNEALIAFLFAMLLLCIWPWRFLWCKLMKMDLLNETAITPDTI